MKPGTAVVLLGLILLFAFFGLLKAIGILLAVVATLVLLLFVAMLVGAWLLKRRMRRKLAELQGALQQAAKDAYQRRKADEDRRDAVDAEFRTDDQR